MRHQVRSHDWTRGPMEGELVRLFREPRDVIFTTLVAC